MLLFLAGLAQKFGPLLHTASLFMKAKSTLTKYRSTWKGTYEAIAKMRKSLIAPVDTIGCASLAEPTEPPKVILINNCYFSLIFEFRSSDFKYWFPFCFLPRPKMRLQLLLLNVLNPIQVD